MAIFLFFWANKSLFNQAGFILLFLFLLALLNLVYCIYFAKPTLNQYGINTVKEILVKKEIRYKIFRPESRLKYSEMMVFPALIYIDQKVPQAFDARGTWVNWSHNLSTSMQQLPADDYFQINKSCIICREIIKEVLPQKNDCLLIIISFQINKSLMTSRRRTTAFKHWLAESN
ncbi:LytTR family transcriptional regulator [Agrobacterium tumefaciens]|nr:LytTR family transcriptional regulator [Agrobacterium tumefaciens]